MAEHEQSPGSEHVHSPGSERLREAVRDGFTIMLGAASWAFERGDRDVRCLDRDANRIEDRARLDAAVPAHLDEHVAAVDRRLEVDRDNGMGILAAWIEKEEAPEEDLPPE